MGLGGKAGGCSSTIVKVVAGVATLAAVAAVIVITVIELSEEGGYTSTRGLYGEYSSAAVASDGTPCAEIGVDILLRGGTAADSSIAAMICSSVVNPHSMGIGGGFLLTYYSQSEGRAYTLIAREIAPAFASRDMFEGNPELSLNGGLAVAVPGETRGYRALYDRFGGGVPWADLFTPSIDLCENGNPVNWHLSHAIDIRREAILEEPSLSMFIDPATGDVLQEGDILYMPDLGATFRVIQDEPDALYTGSLASKFVDDLSALGGNITLEDLANYRVLWSEPLNVTLTEPDGTDYTLYSVPPPGSGSVLAFILNVLDEYDMTPASLDPDNEVVTYQRITETFKYAYALRTYLGDAEYVDVEELVANMTSDEYARSMRDVISDISTSQDPQYYGAYQAPPEDHGTSHVSVLAANGDAVASTSTINTYFGAKIASTQTGILYNNEMDDFSSPNITNTFGVEPSPANFIEPGKRPLSSMCPAIIVTGTGEVRIVTGAAGGTKITTAIALTTAFNLWFGISTEQAIQDFRIHHQLTPMELEYESGFSQNAVDGLAAIGHDMSEEGYGGAVLGIVSVEDNIVSAAEDPRKAGQVGGY